MSESHREHKEVLSEADVIKLYRTLFFAKALNIQFANSCASRFKEGISKPTNANPGFFLSQIKSIRFPDDFFGKIIQFCEKNKIDKNLFCSTLKDFNRIEKLIRNTLGSSKEFKPLVQVINSDQEDQSTFVSNLLGIFDDIEGMFSSEMKQQLPEKFQTGMREEEQQPIEHSSRILRRLQAEDKKKAEIVEGLNVPDAKNKIKVGGLSEIENWEGPISSTTTVSGEYKSKLLDPLVDTIRENNPTLADLFVNYRALPKSFSSEYKIILAQELEKFGDQANQLSNDKLADECYQEALGILKSDKLENQEDLIKNLEDKRKVISNKKNSNTETSRPGGGP